MSKIMSLIDTYHSSMMAVDVGLLGQLAWVVLQLLLLDADTDAHTRAFITS